MKRIESVLVKVAGESMNAYVARPTAENAPGIMVFQEAFGVTNHIKDIANRLAELGYVAVAPEMFHRTAPVGFTGDYEDFSSVTPHTSALTRETFLADIQATYDWLIGDAQVDPERIGSIGFCMGGRASYAANSILPLKAAVAYYAGGLVGPMLELSRQQQGPIMFFWGGLDKHITPEIRDGVAKSMRETGKPFINVEISYADHGFLCSDRKAYNPDAAAEAWPMTTAFFERHMAK